MTASKGLIARWPLFALALAPLILAAPSHAAAVLPTGGRVASGSATISAPSASGLTIDQTSRDAIIDWSSFSIGEGASVTIDNGSGATLDRVTGTSMASLDGVLRATGSVYLIDPNGVIVGRDGLVRTGGSFVASTLDLGAANFLAGGALTFSGTSKASVTNLGKVGALGGNVALIASTVSNRGSLTAANGTVGLVSGYRVTFKDSEHDANGLFSVQVGGKDTSVTNAGLIEAANAELRAEGGNIYALAGNPTGVIRATGVAAGGGRVWLVADGGTLSVAGTIQASGADGAPGTIETSGRTVDLGHASVDSHGGTWLIDPDNLEITAAAAQTISTALASSNVTELTTSGGASYTSGVLVTSGQGNITLDPGASIAWTSDHKLTLEAYADLILGGRISLADGTLDLIAGGSIAVNAPINVSGAGTVDLTAAMQPAFQTWSPNSYLELSFALGASINYGPTDSGGKLTINGQAYTLLYALSEPGSTGPDDGTDDIAGIDNNTAAGGDNGHYALATSVTQPSGQVFTSALAGITGYIQMFEGLGNTVTGLTIADPINNAGGGLFGSSSGTVRDVGIIGGSINYAGSGVTSDDGYVGAIVANNNGMVVNCWSSASVSGGEDKTVGGVVGMNYDGEVVNDSSTGTITGGAGAEVGGLVGANHGGLTTNSFATGVVNGGANASVGGLVGDNGADAGGYDKPGTITESYAAGLVTGGAGALLGGLVGGAGATITDGYYNSGTSGQPAGTQSNGSVGVTTPTLEASLPAGLSASVWGQITGVSFPYLLSFYPAGTTPQVISGVARDTFTGDPIVGATVEIALDGTTDLTSATSGANGFYYVLLPQGSLPSGSTLTSWLSGAAYDGVAVYADAVDERIAAGASATNLNLYADGLTVITPDTTLSATYDDLAGGLGSATTAAGKDVFFTLSGVTSGHNLEIDAQGSEFVFDRGLDLGSGYLKIDASGQISQTAAITTARLYGSSVGGASFTLTGDMIAALYGWSDPTGTLALTDGESVTLDGATEVDALTVVSPGTVKQSAGQSLDVTGALAITSAAGMELFGSNSAGTASLSNSGTGVLDYDGQGTVALASVANAGSVSINAVSGALSIQGVVSGGSLSLASTGATLESGSGAIDTPTMTLSADGGANLGGANRIAVLAAYDGGVLTLENSEQLVLTGTVNAGDASIALTTTAGNIVIKGTVEGATLTLDAQKGELTEASTGAIRVGTLNATADTGIVLTSADNAITSIGTDHTTSGPNEITQ